MRVRWPDVRVWLCCRSGRPTSLRTSCLARMSCAVSSRTRAAGRAAPAPVPAPGPAPVLSVRSRLCRKERTRCCCWARADLSSSPSSRSSSSSSHSRSSPSRWPQQSVSAALVEAIYPCNDTSRSVLCRSLFDGTSVWSARDRNTAAIWMCVA